MTILPFEQTYDTILLEGRFLRQALEKSVKAWEEKDGAFLQMAGIRVVYNVEAPVWARVSSALVAGEDGAYTPLEDDVVYPIVTSQYLAQGGDGHIAIHDNK
jgi:2',3'-cyclic-nucleotide 2'-phosphodiesterase (5'-nucleotidase family)